MIDYFPIILFIKININNNDMINLTLYFIILLLVSCASTQNPPVNNQKVGSYEDSTGIYLPYDITSDSLSIYYDALEADYLEEMKQVELERAKPSSMLPPTKSQGKQSTSVIKVKHIDEEVINEEIEENQITKGSLSYSISDTMEIGKTYDVELRISRLIRKSISEGFIDAEEVKTISTSGNMEVLLFDPDPEKDDPVFIIKTLTNATQFLEGDTSFTTWMWTVKPLRQGEHRLKLIINIIKDGNKKSITVFEQDVKIKATSDSWIYKIRKWWRSNWEWSFSVLILPFIGWWWKRREDKKKTTSIGT